METLYQTMRRKGIDNLYKLNSDDLRDFIKERNEIRIKKISQTDILEKINSMKIGETLTLKLSNSKITVILEIAKNKFNMDFKRYWGGRSFTRTA